MTSVIDTKGAAVIIGGGLAGLTAALSLAPEPVVLLSKAPLGVEASSPLAQGGIAAALGPDDNTALHLADTIAAGDGLCDKAVARAILAAAPSAIEDLMRRGVPFDRDSQGRLTLGLEAAHSRHRIIHASGDASGREIMRALICRIRETPSITVFEGFAARRLIIEDNRLRGIAAQDERGFAIFATGRAVIATGGTGGLFVHTTNPPGSWGQGLALAAKAGVLMADLEFVQFHPTALDSDAFPLKLISETVRGEGAILIDERGERFMASTPSGELAPRDIVARAIWRHMAAGHRVFLDARSVPDLDFARRFPAITALCHRAGIDPATQPIPVRPAAHYHMGGIEVDLAGRTSIEGLWACGECASTGLHGANRLASNSLLEAAVCGRWVAESIKGSPARRESKPQCQEFELPASDPASVRRIVSRAVGVLRNGEDLKAAASGLLPLALGSGAASDPAAVALMIVIAALRREESRGAHARIDFPQRSARAGRSKLSLREAIAEARELAVEAAV